eukprot:200540-Chlamydomonas_euryale.AAC.3
MRAVARLHVLVVAATDNDDGTGRSGSDAASCSHRTTATAQRTVLPPLRRARNVGTWRRRSMRCAQPGPQRRFSAPAEERSFGGLVVVSLLAGGGGSLGDLPACTRYALAACSVGTITLAAVAHISPCERGCGATSCERGCGATSFERGCGAFPTLRDAAAHVCLYTPQQRMRGGGADGVHK